MTNIPNPLSAIMNMLAGNDKASQDLANMVTGIGGAMAASNLSLSTVQFGLDSLNQLPLDPGLPNLGVGPRQL